MITLSGSDRPIPINTTLTAATTSRGCRSRCGTGRPTRRDCADGAASPCGSRTQRWNAGRPLDPAGRLGIPARPSRPDAACGVQAAVAADRGPDDVGAVVDGFDDFSAGSHHSQPSRGDAAGHPGDVSAAWSVARIDRQHGSASLRSGSVAGGEAWCEVAPEMAKAASGS
jgi:hypothetical protein